MSLHTRNTCQRALAAFLKTAQIQLDVGGPIKTLADYPALFPNPETGDLQTVPVGIHIACGEIAENGDLPAEWTALKLPAIIVNSTQSAPNDAGYEVCDLTIFAMTTVEEFDAPTAVDARAGWLEALFNEDNLVTIAAELSDPAAPVQTFSCIGIERDGTAHQQRDNYVLSGLRLKVHCAAR